MIRTRENIHLIYVLLFLTIAFFFLETQDGEKYGLLFSFDEDRIAAGELWRLFTFQFVQGSALSLFFNLLILYIMGSEIEEILGSMGFLAVMAASSLGSVVVGFLTGATLLGSFFLSYSLLFIYAHLFPERVFYIFFVIPVKVKWIAIFALAVLVLGAAQSDSSRAAAAGAALSFIVYRLLMPGRLYVRRPRATVTRPPVAQEQPNAERNLELFRTVSRSLSEAGEIPEPAAQQLRKNVVPGVNICPPADYKPEHEDRYCIRCDGFAECTLRYAEQQAKRT